MLEKIYYLALFLIAICIIRGFVFAWSRRSPLALTLTISALVICLAFHTLDNSVATGMDQILTTADAESGLQHVQGVTSCHLLPEK
ncbi:hypothetical protein ACYA5R_21480 [Klebsiella pneumoniae]|uniref:hypothetical protein n=1 Tax=Klebsiella pneumoniae TaxID=573 RepID=UPI001CC165D6|nr:hypothetical protein [Klebsiella pneumoniae]